MIITLAQLFYRVLVSLSLVLVATMAIAEEKKEERLLKETLEQTLEAKVEKRDGSLLLARLLPKDCEFAGNFSQSRHLNSLPLPLNSTGKLFFACESGLVWQNQTPFPESLIYTRQQLHYRLSDDSHATPLDGLQHYYLSRFLLGLLSADIDAIKAQFAIKPLSSNKHLQLLPKSDLSQKGIHSITLHSTTLASTNDQTDDQQELLISILDAKQQLTKLQLNNFTAYPSTSTNNNINTTSDNCQRALNLNEACAILIDPDGYQITQQDN